MDTGLLVFDRTYLPGENATHPLVLHSARQAAFSALPDTPTTAPLDTSNCGF
ncbi:MAG: hypothetical protein ACK5ME_10510 [Parahaliea sp.]